MSMGLSREIEIGGGAASSEGVGFWTWVLLAADVLFGLIDGFFGGLEEDDGGWWALEVEAIVERRRSRESRRLAAGGEVFSDERN